MGNPERNPVDSMLGTKELPAISKMEGTSKQFENTNTPEDSLTLKERRLLDATKTDTQMTAEKEREWEETLAHSRDAERKKIVETTPEDLQTLREQRELDEVVEKGLKRILKDKETEKALAEARSAINESIKKDEEKSFLETLPKTKPNLPPISKINKKV